MQLYSSSLITSGAIQKGVPITVFLLEIVESNWAETPKSASFAYPLSVNKMLPALMSYSKEKGWKRLCESSCVHEDKQRLIKLEKSQVESLPLSKKTSPSSWDRSSILLHNTPLQSTNRTPITHDYPKIIILAITTKITNNIITFAWF